MASNGMYPALSGAVAAGRALETLSSNLANLTTDAFRGQRVSFREVLAKAQGGPARADQRFVRMGSLVPDTSPGPLRQTGQATDVALDGPGFLEVRTAQGPRYLRGGSLQRTPEGLLVDANGRPLLDIKDQPVRLPDGAAPLFGRAGEINVDGKLVAQLKVVEFARPQALQALGGGSYAASAGDPAQPAQKTAVLGQHLEGANVNPLRAMTEVIVADRHYAALHRAIETFREIDTTAARDLAAIA